MKKFLSTGIRSINPVIIVSLLIFALLYYSEKESAPGPATTGDIRRIISLSPSLTRQIADLGARDRLVGATSLDAPQAGNVPSVGNLIQVDLERILSLRPDIVLASDEDGAVQFTGRIRAAGISVFLFGKNRDGEGIFENYLALARLLGREEAAEAKLKGYKAALAKARGPGPRPRVALFVSHHPLMAVSRASFPGRVIEDAGGTNIFGEGLAPYPIVSAEFIVRLDPDLILSIMPGSEEFFKYLLKDFPGLRVMKQGNIRSIGDDITYYTPADYVRSVAKLSEMLIKEGKRP